MSEISNLIYQSAVDEIGVREWPGVKHNPEVLAYFADSGHPQIREDEVPWCAAFVGAILGRVGLPNTSSLLARSYAKYGTSVALEDAIPGDIVVISRGQPWQGHVFFFESYNPQNGLITGIGGNQSDRVSRASYPASRLVAVRRVVPLKTSLSQSNTMRAAVGSLATGAPATATAIALLDGKAQIVVIVSAVAVAVILLLLMRNRLGEWLGGRK